MLLLKHFFSLSLSVSLSLSGRLCVQCSVFIINLCNRFKMKRNDIKIIFENCLIVVCGVWLSWGSMLNVKYFILFQWISMWNGRLGRSFFFFYLFFDFICLSLLRRLFLFEYRFSCFTMRITFRDFVNWRFAWSYII